MAKKWNGKECPLCFKGTLHDGIKRRRIEYKGHAYKYDQPGAWCDHCDEGILTGSESSSDQAAWLKFRNEVDHKEAAILAKVRRRLKLTQQQAAKLTGGGKNAFSRYERGEAKPMAAVINLFRLLDKHPELLKELQ